MLGSVGSGRRRTTTPSTLCDRFRSRSALVRRQHSPLSLLCITMILRVRRKILKLLRSPTMIGYKDLPTIDADSKKELYPGCKKKYSRLSATLALLRFKAANGLSNKGFTEMLGLFKEILPEDNVLPRSTNEAKKIVCPLELEVQKIHACVNDCILYRGEYKDLRACPTCKHA